MQKGENIISLALAAVVVITILAIQRKWNPAASLKDAASSAEEFILSSTGIRGQIPDIPGYEKVKTFRLESYDVGLYRASPAPLVFAPGRLVVYNRQNQPVIKVDTLEGSRDAWTTLYDFTGRRGVAAPGSRARPEYARDLEGNHVQDIVIGQYSGGDHCCTLATIVRLDKGSATVVGKIDGLDGLPFEGLEIRRLDKDPSWELIAHRPYITSCGPHADAADVISIFANKDGRYADQTALYTSYLKEVLRQNLAKWKQEKNRTLELLQTLAVSYTTLGQKEEGGRFFASNLNLFLPQIRNQGIDPNACQDDLDNLLDRLPAFQ
jgi:hypothetical protein